MVDRFQELQDRGSVAFEVWSGSATNSVREWSLQDFSFPHVIIPSLKIGSRRVDLPFGRLRRMRPARVVTFHGQLPLALAPLVGLRRDTELIYYVEKTFDDQFRRHWLKEAVKRLMFRYADGFLTPGNDADGFLAKYNIGPSQILRLPHVLQVGHFNQAIERRGADASVLERAELGLGDFVFAYVGRLAPRKGTDVLLRAFERIHRRYPTSSLLLVGDPPHSDFGDVESAGWIDEMTRDRPGVVVTGFVQQEALPRLLSLADVFVFPTKFDTYGLVIDEALAAGLPVICSSQVGELSSRVVDGVTGYVVPSSDAEALEERMVRVLESPDELKRMSISAATRVRDWTPNIWAESIETLVSRSRWQ